MVIGVSVAFRTLTESKKVVNKMYGIMKKTYHDSFFRKLKLSDRYAMENIDRDDLIVIQALPLNDKDIIVEVVEKDKYKRLIAVIESSQ